MESPDNSAPSGVMSDRSLPHPEPSSDRTSNSANNFPVSSRTRLPDPSISAEDVQIPENGSLKIQLRSLRFDSPASRRSRRRASEQSHPRSRPPKVNESSSATDLHSMIAANNAAIDTALHTLPRPARIPGACGGNTALRRLRTEYAVARDWQEASLLPATSPPTGENDIFVILAPLRTDDLYVAKGSFKGPTDSPYEGGIFHVEMKMPPEYPLRPPKCRFLTRIFHPNIDFDGEICLNILANEWCPALCLEKILISICSMLYTPLLDDALMPNIALLCRTDRPRFRELAREWTVKYAMGDVVQPRGIVEPHDLCEGKAEASPD